MWVKIKNKDECSINSSEIKVIYVSVLYILWNHFKTMKHFFVEKFDWNFKYVRSLKESMLKKKCQIFSLRKLALQTLWSCWGMKGKGFKCNEIKKQIKPFGIHLIKFWQILLSWLIWRFELYLRNALILLLFLFSKKCPSSSCYTLLKQNIEGFIC